MPERLRVATWNVHSCIGSDGRHDPARVRRVIRGLAANVVALQEVDSRIAGHDGFRDLGAAMGPDHAHCRTLRTPDGDYGHMLLSTAPILEWAVRDISIAAREPRSVIDAILETGCGQIRVLSTHLGLGRHERTRQVEVVQKLVAERESGVILMGDFNEATRFGPASRAFDTCLASVGRLRTFPARYPILPLDRIWCGPPIHVERAWTIREAGKASDHLPLVAELYLGR